MVADTWSSMLSCSEMSGPMFVTLLTTHSLVCNGCYSSRPVCFQVKKKGEVIGQERGCRCIRKVRVFL